MLRLCTYIIGKDTGLAPNPFWGWCTLSVCTPNRQGAKLRQGDYIAGFTPKENGNQLIYLMKIHERIHLDSYFNDPRFAKKIPGLSGSWKERCGDNFYSLAKDGSWKQHKNRFHIGSEYLQKDTRVPFAFVANEFWYFGRSALDVPLRFANLIGGRGIRVNHPQELVQEFLNWVSRNHKQGIHDIPLSNPDIDLTSHPEATGPANSCC